MNLITRFLSEAHPVYWVLLAVAIILWVLT